MKVFFFFLFLLCSFQFFAQKKDKDSFTYLEQSELTWETFKGRVPVITTFAASVNTGVGLKWSYSTLEGKIDLQYEVEAYVQPNFSWVIEEEKDDELLKHEQLHFDISELHARMLRKRVSEYKFGRNIRKSMQKILGDIKYERLKMQSDYDEQTHHSKNVDQQLLWEKNIAELLEKYKEFSENPIF